MESTPLNPYEEPSVSSSKAAVENGLWLRLAPAIGCSIFGILVIGAGCFLLYVMIWYRVYRGPIDPAADPDGRQFALTPLNVASAIVTVASGLVSLVAARWFWSRRWARAVAASVGAFVLLAVSNAMNR